MEFALVREDLISIRAALSSVKQPEDMYIMEDCNTDRSTKDSDPHVSK
jgi:hypothetical protein